MLDKIRSHARRELPGAYVVNLGKGFDEKCTTFLRVSYELVVEYVHAGLADEAILQTCFAMGRQPSEAEIYMWNEFMRKRGWHDEVSEMLEGQKKGKPCFPGRRFKQCFNSWMLMKGAW